jgi:hypothetical protein
MTMGVAQRSLNPPEIVADGARAADAERLVQEHLENARKRDREFPRWFLMSAVWQLRNPNHPDIKTAVTLFRHTDPGNREYFVDGAWLRCPCEEPNCSLAGTLNFMVGRCAHEVTRERAFVLTGGNP